MRPRYGTKKNLITMLGVTACLFIANVSARVSAHGTSASAVAISQSTDQYLVEFKGNLPDDVSRRIAALGGTIVDTFPEMRIVLVSGMTEGAATALASQTDVADVTLDQLVMPSDELGNRRSQLTLTVPSAAPSTASFPESAVFYPFQWDKRVISADKAWRAGFFGSPDVRLAMIDTGIDPTHPELAGLIDASRSISYCPRENPIIAQEFPGYPDWTDVYGHGTFTAAIASSNSHLLAGVTSRTTLMAIKTLGLLPCNGSGVFRGIVYAANHDADVINMSLGFVPLSKGGTRGLVQRGLFYYINRAVQYALTKGVSAVVVSAGNDSIDLDHNADNIQIFCDVPGVICVSATGPTNSGPLYLGPFANIDDPAFYSNFGVSAIDVAAPGGNLSFDSSGNIIGDSYIFSACATTDRMFDTSGNLVPGFCTGNGITTAGAIGTSGAAPEVSGLAALLVSQLGRGKAAQVRAAIENSVDDLGKPGADPHYGKGRINVARALGVQ